MAAVTEFPAKPLEIAVGGDGQVFFARGIQGFPYLAAALRMRRGADGTAAREPDGSWSRDIVLRVASSLPWEVVGWVVDACAESHLKAHRLHFAALSEPGGVEGVVPCFLPKAPAGVSQLRSLDVRLDAAAEPADDSRVAKAVERRLAMLGGSARVALHVSAGVAAGRVIRALDVVRRVNGAGVTFLGSPEPAADARSGPRPPVPDPQRYAREHPVSQPGFSVTFADGETIGADPLPPPSADRPPR